MTMPGRLRRYVSGGGPTTRQSSPPESIPEDHTPGLTREKTKSKIGRTSPDRMDHLRKHSLANALSNRSKSKETTRTPSRDNGRRSISQAKGSPSPALRPTRPVNKLRMQIESPPNVFYGNERQSSGALMSGQLLLTVVDPDFQLESFEMTLYNCVTSKKPVVNGCPECTQQIKAFKEWKFLKEPKHLDAEEHSFPFSYLLQGHLPTTSETLYGTLEYYLEAKAVPVKRPGHDSQVLTLRHYVPVLRALHPAPEKNSLRIFPPTNLTAHVTLSPVIYPMGDFNVLMKLNGLVDKQKDVISRWRLRKMSWKLEETEKWISPACNKHSAKLGGENKGVQHEDVRILGEEELKEGWKNDWSEGSLEMEFSARPLGLPKPVCDVDSPTGLTITHALVIELVVAEEWAPLKKPDALTPTGAARVLRMQFNVQVTERSGMGISWDEEQPPVYEDVPASPPVYAADDKRKMKLPAMPASALISPSMVPLGGSRQRDPSSLRLASTREYTGPPLDGSMEEDIERLHLDADAWERPSARSRRRLDLDDFLGNDRADDEEEEVDPRGPPPPPRDDD